MRTFRAIFKLELANFLRKRNLFLLLSILLLSLVLSQDSANSYTSQIAEIKTFVEVEHAKVKEYVLTTQYGAYGIRVLYVPTPQNILYNNNKCFDHLLANIDVGERLNIYNSYKGNKLFARSINLLNLADFLLLSGSILSILYGFFSVSGKDFLRFLAGLTDVRLLFISLFISRLILVTLSLLVIYSASGLLLLFHGFNLFNIYTLVSYLLLSGLFSFFLLSGMMAGMAKTVFRGLYYCISLLCLLFLVFPWLIDKAMEVKSGQLPSSYTVELEKLKLIMGFEEKFYKEIGIYSSRHAQSAPGNVKKLIESYINNQYPQIIKIEESMRNQMAETISYYHLLHSFIPTTFCSSVNNETSSKGYRNFIDFYTYTQELKNSFFKYYILTKYFKPVHPVEPYFQKEDYLFNGQSHFPQYFVLGLVLLFFYNSVLFVTGFLRFRWFIFQAAIAKKDISPDFKIEIEPGDNLWLNLDHYGVGLLYRMIFDNRQEGQGKILVNARQTPGLPKTDMIYLCHPDALPTHITPLVFIQFLRVLFRLSRQHITELKSLLPPHLLGIPLENLDTADKGRVLLTALRVKPFLLYLFHDFFKGMAARHLTFFIQEMNRVTDTGSGVIYLSLDDSYSLYTQANRFAKIYKKENVYTFIELSRQN